HTPFKSRPDLGLRISVTATFCPPSSGSGVGTPPGPAIVIIETNEGPFPDSRVDVGPAAAPRRGSWRRWAPTDRAVFPTAGHLGSGAGLCPGNDQSGGKRRTGKTTKGSQWLRAVRVQVAWSASHTEETIVGSTYRRWAKRLGKKKTPVALAHKIL